MFNNNLLLCRFMLRRDRLRAIFWLLGLLVLVAGFGAAIPGMYPSAEERILMAETLKSPAMVSMLGPVYDSGGYTTGALYANYMLLWSAMIMGIMNIFLVVRHTRQDEERGRIEVIRSLPVGRLSTLSAVLTDALIINTAFSIILGLSVAVLGIESMDIAGSMLFGAAMGAVGLVFAGVTAVFCQLCAGSGAAQSLSFGFLIAAYMVRAAGDMGNEVIACISPLGLVLRTKVFVEDTWVPILLLILTAAGFALIAFWLCAKRDMGSGLIPARPGRKNAAPYLKSAEGLAWRLLRSPFIIWNIVIYLIGIAYGSIMGDMESFISTNELFKTLFPDGDPAQFISFLMVIMSIIGTIPIIQFVLKARSQEKRGYAENILARSVSHYRQLTGYYVIALIMGVAVPFFSAFGFWSGSVTVMENPISFLTLLQASLVYIPAIWFMLGAATLAIAFLPQLTVVVWVYLGYAFFILYIGSAMKLPGWMGKISPFGHIPKLPMEKYTVTGTVVLILLAAAMSAAGFIGYRRRDMKSA